MSEYRHEFEQDGHTRTIVVEYQKNGDTYTVDFAGDLLRDEELDVAEVGRALQGMAQHRSRP